MTGASRGLGLEGVRQLAPKIERLFATCRWPDAAFALAEVAEAHPGTVDRFALDVADPDRRAAAADRVRWAAGEVDLLPRSLPHL